MARRRDDASGIGLRFRRSAYRLARAGLRLIDKRDPSWQYELHIDYPPLARYPRYGFGRPRHEALAAFLRRHAATFRDELHELVAYRDDLLRIPVHAASGDTVCWHNGYIPGPDTVSLYGYVRRRQPKTYLEVGSGFSTAVVHRARTDGNTGTRLVSIDPNPRAEIDELCDEVIRTPLELTDLTVFSELTPGDMVFFDASHRIFMNCDTVAFFLDVLPALPDGVLVGVHDIFWPDDYPPDWVEYWFSEQYLLAGFILAEAPWLRPTLAVYYAMQEPDLASALAPVLDDPRLATVDRRGTSFWFEIDRRASSA